MSTNLAQEELKIVLALENVGLSAAVATLAVVMVTRGHARPENELADIVRQYPQLEDRDVAAAAIRQLIEKGWLIVSTSYGRALVRQSPDLSLKIAEAIGQPEVAEQLNRLRSPLEPYIRNLGPVSDDYAFASFLDLLKNAQKEICLPMLMTSPENASAPIVQERAKRGVNVRIMLGSPDVAATLRGEPSRKIARDAIRGWKKHKRGIPQMKIRMSHSADDMALGTCVGIDGNILRFDIYDPSRQRSLDGVMLEVISPTGYDLNLVGLFNRAFDDAWDHAQPLNPLGGLGWLIGRNWQWWACGFFTFLTVVFRNSIVGGLLFGSVASTFFLNAFVSSWVAIRAFFHRLRTA